jgi:prepilin-type N-terminal cleavage/methylation domain-containing protein/prepilin-type processing-associated H-X9-DG protein
MQVMKNRNHAFTLIELMVTVAIVALLMVMLIPALQAAKAMGAKAACAANLRHLHAANTLYAGDRGHYVAAASDLLTTNRKRWHGGRTGAGHSFRAELGPMQDYLGSSGELRRCPALRSVETNSSANAFESSCGGYGYNAIGVGSRIYQHGFNSAAMAQGMKPEMIANASETVMFADCAFPQPYGPNPDYLIEYSFAEPYHWVLQAGQESGMQANPSVHFRHRGRALVVWCDGHVSDEVMETTAQSYLTAMNVGWFGPEDNTYWDPY